MSDVNTDQRDFWTDNAGPVWVAQMAAMDRLLAPVLEGVLQRADIDAGNTVLDIGCGAGTSTMTAAEQAGPSGRAIGLDISATLLEVARDMAKDKPPVDFLLADAQIHTFEPVSVDRLISRFGVMFFEDSMTAFTNMGLALKPGGAVTMATWGPIPENPYFTLPAGVAKQVLGPVPKSDPDGPGPFAFRDVERVHGIFKSAGFDGIGSETVSMSLTPSGTKEDVAALMCQIGPAQNALAHHEADAAQKEALTDALAEALTPFETDQGIIIPASINFFTATKPA